MRELLAQRGRFAVFVAGGLLCAIIDIGVMQLLIRSSAGIPMATSIGFGAGLLLNYAFHARLTFKARTSSLSFMRYLCVVGMNYLLTMVCVSLAVMLLTEPQQHSALFGKLVSLPLVAINGFLLSKHWIFK